MTRAFRIELSLGSLAAVLAAAMLCVGCDDGSNDSVDAGVVDSGITEDAGPVDAGPTCAPGMDADQDGICDDVDRCPLGDDLVDADHDTVPDGCDRCENHDDRKDLDGDGVPNACDICADGDDKVDADGDLVPDHCDVCPDDANDDSDLDGVCDSIDGCPGKDDRQDADGDGVADACDPLPDSAGTVDTDGDGVGDEVDQCPGASEGWGQAGEDLDNDLLEDGCDACAGDNSRGDADKDGFCNIIGTDDNCPGVDDLSPACPASSCANGDIFSPACPDLPWRGGSGGNGATWYPCPQDGFAVGIETDTYNQTDALGARLICKDSAGAITYQGQYGSPPSTDSTPSYELRCDQEYADGRLVGNISAIHKGSGAMEFFLGRIGAVCSSEQAGMIWRIEPASSSGTVFTYTDVCTGPHETVTAIKIKTGWWCDGVQLSCSTVP